MTRHRAIEQEALHWLIRKEEPDWSEGAQAELAHWLDASDAHKAAFWRAEYGWRKADRIRALGAEGHRAPARPALAVGWRPALIAASLVIAVALGSYWTVPEPRTAPHLAQTRYATPVGARITVRLTDGSKVELNTATVMRAAVSRQKRELWLDSGEAYFEVAHREGLPFVVHAGKQRITVLGTKFSVRRDGDRVVVNVLEGRVRVEDGASNGDHASIIGAGDFAVARGPSTLVTTKSEEHVESALAWRDGMIVFDQTALSDVVAEFNRYNRKPITMGNDEAGEIRIGGAFQASNVDAFLRLLRDAYGLKVEETADRIKISS